MTVSTVSARRSGAGRPLTWTPQCRRECRCSPRPTRAFSGRGWPAWLRTWTRAAGGASTRTCSTATKSTLATAWSRRPPERAYLLGCRASARALAGRRNRLGVADRCAMPGCGEQDDPDLEVRQALAADHKGGLPGGIQPLLPQVRPAAAGLNLELDHVPAVRVLGTDRQHVPQPAGARRQRGDDRRDHGDAVRDATDSQPEYRVGGNGRDSDGHVPVRSCLSSSGEMPEPMTDGVLDQLDGDARHAGARPGELTVDYDRRAGRDLGAAGGGRELRPAGASRRRRRGTRRTGLVRVRAWRAARRRMPRR